MKENGAIIESSTYFDTLLKEKTLANGYKVCYNYDNKGRVVSATESATEDNSEILVVTVAYNGDNTTVTHANGVTYTSEKENSDSVTSRFTATNDGKTLKIEGVPLTDAGEKSQTKYYIDGNLYNTEILTKDEHGRIKKINHNGYFSNETSYTYDDENRVKQKYAICFRTVGTGIFSNEYEYKTVTHYLAGEEQETNLVSKDAFGIGGNKETDVELYEYYANGNVKKITKSGNGSVKEYFYDDFGRLTVESNTELNRKFIYTYDNNGNITKKQTCDISGYETLIKTDLYEYGDANRKDLLTKYNGATITYDKYGNPLAYKGKLFEWKGKNLVKADGLQMEYDYNGLRTKKGNKKYFWYGNRLIAETYTGNGLYKTIYYRYDDSGVCGMIVETNSGSSEYYFRKNIFGDVIAVYNTAGAELVSYDYDAFGNFIVTETSNSDKKGLLNPFRYRGYYWDSEFNLYYLKSRYYDPEIGRFISPDSVEYINPSEIFGLNLYAYCYNNPINFKKSNLIVNGITTTIPILKSSSVEIVASDMIFKQITKTFLPTKAKGFNLFGYGLRHSAGWSDSPTIATGWFGRVGKSYYTTNTQGRAGVFHAFAGSVSDVMNWFDITYFAGIGINIFDIIGFEFQFETVGIGAQVSIGNYSIGININLIGGTSITFGDTVDLGNGETHTVGVTVGINTGFLVAVMFWLFKTITTGDPSPIPGLVGA